MIAARHADHTRRRLFGRQVGQPMPRPANLESPHRLEAFGLAPDGRAVDLQRQQGRRRQDRGDFRGRAFDADQRRRARRVAQGIGALLCHGFAL